MKKLLVLAGLLLGQSAIAQVQPETKTGSMVVGVPTGGNEGTGSVNMQSCFVNGVACAAGGGTPPSSVFVLGTSAGGAFQASTAPSGTSVCNPNATGSPVAPTANTNCIMTGAVITPTGAPTSITAAAQAAQQGVLLDAFKVSGDADDTASLTRADTAGVPILLGPRTYTINNFVSTTGATFILKGVKGASVIQRTSASGSQFFEIQETTVYIDGVTFDMNEASVTANQHGVYLPTGGQNVSVTNSVFKNNWGTISTCLELLGSGPSAGGWFKIDGNEFTNCTNGTSSVTGVGINMASVANGVVSNNFIHANAFGAQAVANGSASSSNYSTNITFSNNLFLANSEHLYMGGFGSPYNFGTSPATNILVTSNSFIDQTSFGASSNYYMVTVQGDYISVIGNHFLQTSTGTSAYGGIDANARYQLIQGNDINLPSAFWGIDTGASEYNVVTNNKITNTHGTAMNAGGSWHEVISDNTFNISSASGYSIAIAVNAAETDGSNNAFTTVSNDIRIEHNTINFLSTSTVNGIGFYNNACGYAIATETQEPCIVRDNNFSGTESSLLDIFFTGTANSVEIQNNRHNGTSALSISPSGTTLLFDVVYDEIIVSTNSHAINSLQYTGFSGHVNVGAILWVSPNNGGTGYHVGTTTLALSGCTGGTGFTASPQINQGVIVGVSSVGGSGYTGGTSCVVTATDSNGSPGSGATFTVGVNPVFPANKRLRIFTDGNSITNTSPYPTWQGLSGTVATTANYPLELEAVPAGNAWQVMNLPFTGTSYTWSIAGAGCGGSAASVTNQNNTTNVVTWNVGTAPSGNTCTLAVTPAAAITWHCTIRGVSAIDSTIQTGAQSTTGVTFTHYAIASATASTFTAALYYEMGCTPE